MATIKAIEGRTVHQIQSGQVIVDLCSVLKELVENSLDAGATSIDVRFKNHGLEAIEVQDNGYGIAPDDYETIALKHFTSKLSTYEDLANLDTFGFRGEALSSLCALSRFHIVTARDGEAPKGKRLDFESSGKLKGTTVAACPKGTTISVEELFYNLPVRKRELEKNIKREYGKVLTILHAYACISTGVRFSVSNQMAKGKKAVVFSTKSNTNTKDNIANVFGARVLPTLVTLDLTLELQPSANLTFKDAHVRNDEASRKVCLVGHVSRPVFGEGRQTPDRQMFFVNSRPCSLPQVAKAFNEVYKSYNLSQSPFIFANFQMDTNAYDVNVSPDKRTIMLHDQNALLETLKRSLSDLFEAQEQTVPQSQIMLNMHSAFKPLTLNRETSLKSTTASVSDGTKAHAHPPSDGSSPFQPSAVENDAAIAEVSPRNLIQRFSERNAEERKHPNLSTVNNRKRSGDEVRVPVATGSAFESLDPTSSQPETRPQPDLPRAVQNFNQQLENEQARTVNEQTDEDGDAIFEIPTISATRQRSPLGVVQSAFDRMRPKRTSNETASITIGSTTISEKIRTPPNKRRRTESSPQLTQSSSKKASHSGFGQRLHAFAAPGTEIGEQADGEDIDEVEESAEDGEYGTSDHETGSASEVDEMRLDQNHKSSRSNDDGDGEYQEEAERRRRDAAKVEELVRLAEEGSSLRPQEQKKRLANLMKLNVTKDSTVGLVTSVESSSQRIRDLLARLKVAFDRSETSDSQQTELDGTQNPKMSAEERLSLTITKSDFTNMRIIGQFNLGFILVTRSANPFGITPSIVRGNSKTNATELAPSSKTDLFIIDQHASDEIYNFSRLSKTTTLTPQPLVRPYPLELTAIEEETILTHTNTLAKNGFNITFDDSGHSPVGQRCHLLTLPTSRETIFDPRDLEELISLLGEANPAAGEVIRPSRVRKMLAMRACRSSVMVGKNLSMNGMERVVRHMGEIERPWNCPHGRPTMRHLAGLGQWQSWEEGDGLTAGEEEGSEREETDWHMFLERARQDASTGREEIWENDNYELQDREEEEPEEEKYAEEANAEDYTMQSDEEVDGN